MSYPLNNTAIVPEEGISHGLLNGHKVISNFGYNRDIDQNVLETVWPVGGEFDPSAVTGAETLNLVSTSANDTDTSGTGARKVKVFGLDGSYNEIVEDVSLAGTGTATTSATFRAINFMQVSESGSGLKNDGDVTATQSTSGLTLGQIPTGEGDSEQCIYTVPAGYTAYLKYININSGKTGAGQRPQIDCEIFVYDPDANTNYQITELILDTAIQNNIVLSQPYAEPILEKCTFQIDATSDIDNAEVFCRFFMGLVANK